MGHWGLGQPQPGVCSTAHIPSTLLATRPRSMQARLAENASASTRVYASTCLRSSGGGSLQKLCVKMLRKDPSAALLLPLGLYLDLDLKFDGKTFLLSLMMAILRSITAQRSVQLITRQGKRDGASLVNILGTRCLRIRS